jgi:small-conductance mechanosensitive channel
VLEPIVNLLNDSTPLYQPWGRIVVIVSLFTLAWLTSRGSAMVARRVLAWQDRRREGSELGLASWRRRETLVGVLRMAVSYAGFATAMVLSVGQLIGGIDRLTAVAGASFLLIVAGFTLNRILPDLVAGFFMVSERWYSVGDMIAIPVLELQGVVEGVSLRHTKLRSLSGELIHVNNSQVAAVRVLPRGSAELSVELYVSDDVAAQVLLLDIVTILPESATTFVRRPAITEVEPLTDELTRISLRASVAPGREWLVEGFLCDLLRQRAPDGLVVHGPVVLSVDDKASRSFARAGLVSRAGG